MPTRTHYPHRQLAVNCSKATWRFKAGEVIAGSVVTRGKLRIGAGARVLGSVKSNKEMLVEAGVSVEGSLISATTIHIGPNCWIGGPLIAEHGMVIESGTQCGGLGHTHYCECSYD